MEYLVQEQIIDVSHITIIQNSVKILIAKVIIVVTMKSRFAKLKNVLNQIIANNQVSNVRLCLMELVQKIKVAKYQILGFVMDKLSVHWLNVHFRNIIFIQMMFYVHPKYVICMEFQSYVMGINMGVTHVHQLTKNVYLVNK